MPILVPAVVLLLPLIDLVWAVVRRLSKGQSPFHADAGHLHHRLLRRGHSHSGAVLVLYIWAAIASVGGVAMVIWPVKYVIVGVGIAALIGLFFTRRELLLAKNSGDGDATTRVPDVNVIGDN